ncbi:hypothetical protein LMK08_21325 [Metapseudomonas furukawaii]|uniref:hypothetical protein n=1 Tax=Metapseudomonas furukawaii TaxID=1149133 RepID=UPI00227B469D|nr:hypothetical protein [Pseudomonas furukawaii]WAG77880.1 hypothetical protein LMK08_21325 [Pseudomonas furukawaii]
MQCKSDIIEFYEKLYFHEAEVKEQISQRLQIPSVVVISIISLYGVLLQGMQVERLGLWHVAFFILLIVSLRFSIVAMMASIRALSGHSYAFLPPAEEIESYRAKLIDTYKNYPDQKLEEKYFSDYLVAKYSKCASHNSKVNDARSGLVYSANLNIAWCIPFLVLLFLVQAFTEVNKQNRKEILSVSIASPVLIKEASPLQIQGRIEEKTITIELSDEIKELLNDRPESTATNTAAAPSAPTISTSGAVH